MGCKTIEGLNSCLDRNSFSLLSRYAGLQRIFSITGYNQIIQQCWRDELDKYRKDHSIGSLLRSIIGMHIFGMNSVDEIHDALEKNQGSRFSCECIDGPASRSQMSRDINGMDLSMVITGYIPNRSRTPKDIILLLGCKSYMSLTWYPIPFF